MHIPNTITDKQMKSLSRRAQKANQTFSDKGIRQRLASQAQARKANQS